MKLILYKNQILCMNMSDFIVFFLSLYTHRASQWIITEMSNEMYGKAIKKKLLAFVTD